MAPGLRRQSGVLGLSSGAQDQTPGLFSVLTWLGFWPTVPTAWGLRTFAATLRLLNRGRDSSHLVPFPSPLLVVMNWLASGFPKSALR